MTGLSEHDVQRIADAVEERKPDFYVDPEEHYNQHQRLDRFLDAYDAAGKQIKKFFLGVLLVGIMAAMALGLGWHK